MIRVSAPVGDPDVPAWSEVMHAAPDPADPDQAVLLNVPFLVDEINFGDLVRLGPEDERGVRPILEVVLASGHVHLIAATDPDETAYLIAELERTFPAYSLRIERARGGLVSVSAHPDVEPGDVFEVVSRWLASEAEVEEEGLARSPPLETRLGELDWPASSA